MLHLGVECRVLGLTNFMNVLECPIALSLEKHLIISRRASVINKIFY